MSTGASSILLEKGSFNRGYVEEDVNCKLPLNSECISQGCDQLNTELDVNKICQKVNKSFEFKNLKARCNLSSDPGRLNFYLKINKLIVHI